MTGAGNIPLDIALFMLTVGAACVSAYLAFKWFSATPELAVLRVLRATGWSILSARFGFLLFTVGDLPVSVPSIIALAFLACGDIAMIFYIGKAIRI